MILWGRNDTVLPWACLEALRAALGEPPVRTVDGSHGWLLTQPERFAEEITNIMGMNQRGLRRVLDVSVRTRSSRPERGLSTVSGGHSPTPG